MENFLDNLFDLTIEIDGSLNKLNTETIQLQYLISKQAQKTNKCTSQK